MQTEKKSFFTTRFIQFMGGKNLLFGLITLLLAGCIIWIYDRISFIFYPIVVFLRTVVLPVILAVIAYYLLRPILKILVKWKVPKVGGIFLIYIVGIGLISLFVTLIFPFLKEQFMNLIQEFPSYFMQVVHSVQHLLEDSRLSETLAKYNFDLNSVLNNISNQLNEMVKDASSEIGTGLASGVTGFISTLTGIILAIVTVPFILFYLLKDGENLPNYLLKLLPPRMRKDTAHVLHEADHQISSYIQGQILVAICIGIMVTIGFLIIGLPYAVILGVLAMMTSVVPYLGPVIAITPAAIIAVVNAPIMLLKLAVVWTIVQLVEGKFISPQIMGKSLHVHPITIIFVLLTSGSLFGVPGVVLGIPGYAVLKVLVSHLFYLFKRRYNKYNDQPSLNYELDDWAKHREDEK
ncbi:AI-2E family transporter [Rummeliibacillus stabekisii]|uniref:AI-2E family transporter n=1 Tax=Rummeliibacillus stabekisii TaxID=241244 RepID=UPI0037181E8D